MASPLLKRLDEVEAAVNERLNPDSSIDKCIEKYLSLYDWQIEFLEATATYNEVCLCAANRIGKTYTGTFIDAVHAMGTYPDDWKGHRFDHPPLVWCLGYSGEKTRDLLQSELFGRKTDKGFSGGLIPANKIVGWESMTGTSGAMRSVLVKHSSGGISKVQFWSYSQGQHALMGDSVDWFHIDEEPKDQSIHPQVLTRTATGDKGKGGRGILTFTPENGRTDLVIKFMDDPGKGQFFMQKGWDDTPHLSEEVKDKLLESFPHHQRDMRTKGVPMLGHGRIYEFSEDFIVCDPFEIPEHWKVIGGMDFGWDHPQAHVRIAINPDTEEVYLTHAFKASKLSANDAWGAVKSWQQGVPVSWPHDGLQHEKGRDDAKQQKDHYNDAGFNMLPQRATWDGSSSSVEQGLYELRQLMQVGKFKVFAGNRCFFDEFNQYHRDEKGKIVKIRDDVLDALRYAYMMRRQAKALGDILAPKKIKPKFTKTVSYW